MKKIGKMNWDKISDKIKEQEKTTGKFKKKIDERIYQPEIKKDGTAQAIIRFLPSPDTEIPFVKKYSHGFKGINGWYIEDCPTTYGKTCPVCKANSYAWNNGDQNTARRRARRLSVYSNILVIKDPQNPENEGKVFLYRYGKKIHEKLMSKIDPGEESIDEPIMIFDPKEGANFRLKINMIKVDGKSMPNYDSSQFDSQSEISDKKLEKIEDKLYNLSEFIDPSTCKTEEELSVRFKKVIGEASNIVPEKTETPNESKSDDIPFKGGETHDDKSEEKDSEELDIDSDDSDDNDSDDDFFASLQDD